MVGTVSFCGYRAQVTKKVLFLVSSVQFWPVDRRNHPSHRCDVYLSWSDTAGAASKRLMASSMAERLVSGCSASCAYLAAASHRDSAGLAPVPRSSTRASRPAVSILSKARAFESTHGAGPGATCLRRGPWLRDSEGAQRAPGEPLEDGLTCTAETPQDPFAGRTPQPLPCGRHGGLVTDVPTHGRPTSERQESDDKPVLAKAIEHPLCSGELKEERMSSVRPST